MKIARFGAGFLSVAMLAGIVGVAHGAPLQKNVLPESARILTPDEIYKLYRDKSWQWTSGAGHMNGTDRTFSAWSDGETGQSWAEGRWVITRTGQMCLKAAWHSSTGAAPATTCFSHRIDKGTIYQKREPKGDWYVFRHAETRADDEAGKLTDTDMVSARIDTVKAAIGKSQTTQQ